MQLYKVLSKINQTFVKYVVVIYTDDKCTTNIQQI